MKDKLYLDKKLSYFKCARITIITNVILIPISVVIDAKNVVITTEVFCIFLREYGYIPFFLRLLFVVVVFLYLCNSLLFHFLLLVILLPTSKIFLLFCRRIRARKL